MNRFTFIMLVISVLISGCQSMSEDECLMANWEAVGYEDGSNGLPAGDIGRHREACARYSVVPNLERYQRGRTEGLKMFCQPTRGFLHGRSGAVYGGVCPRNLEEGFRAGYKDGKRIGDGERHLANLQSKLAGLERRYEEVVSILDDSRREERVISDEPTRDERAFLLGRAKDLRKEKEQLEENIRHLRLDIEDESIRLEIMLFESDFL